MSSPANTRRGRGPSASSAAAEVRRRVQNGGDRHWQLRDFPDLSAAATAHALSRLASDGELQRVRKGLYWRPKMTALGPSLPSATQALAQTFAAPLHPAGLTAASALGFTTQNPGRPEFSTPAAAGPGALSGATIHTRRPHARHGLDNQDAALLEILRDRATTSDLPTEETIDRLLEFVGRPATFRRLTDAALSEPPRVRAMLGALGQQAGMPKAQLARLRDSLNPISRFDFGPLAALNHAREWQAK
ncbi:hypothetical protein GKE82_11415 [Conexibacter sp. W3-3-2]|uniref:AbiEi antitoxin N-terminal domain-containing protein n=1 Tax=Conexibacter sp. W3-3-2 TaxID=2675227 RepID=UPI001326F15E|nr:AbiEi antitoxin N-terminal domain-containing protein [Conexibacter sp. W3-3-2]MTD44883.1 hypothetical protein [Conexibacter sp. W3-3-2]